jgi:hypothetical protein
VSGGDGDGGGGWRRLCLVVYSPVARSVTEKGREPVGPIIVAETPVAMFDIGVVGKNAEVALAEEVVSEAYIVAVAVEGIAAGAMLDTVERNEASKFVEGAE